MTVLLAAALAICPTHGARQDCVHDGDTWWLSGEKSRLANFDAPDMNGKCAFERQLAIRARDRLAELLAADDIRLQRLGTDRYRRTLVVVTVFGRSLGDIMFQEGLVRRWPPNDPSWCK